MRIVIATPLYPPDTAEPAHYAKELARRLSAHHDVRVLAYGDLPEPVAGVRVMHESKRRPLFIRLPSYFFALFRAAREADLIYAINGASVELPATLVSVLARRPLFFVYVDRLAHERAESRLVFHMIEEAAKRHAKKVIESFPLKRPETFSFLPRPVEEERDYEKSWEEHLTLLSEAFDHAK
jgi:hypothetical protein